MHVYDNWIKETTATTGTGTLALDGAASGFAAFSASSKITNNTTVYYVIKNGTSWEHGIGTWQTGNSLVRTTVKATMVAGVIDDTTPTALNLSGTSEVMISMTSTMIDDMLAYAQPKVTSETVTTDRTLVEADSGKVFIISGSDIDITLPSAAAVSNGWGVTLVNDNSTNTATAHASASADTPFGQKTIRIIRAGSDTVDGIGTDLHGASMLLPPRHCIDVWKTSASNFTANTSDVIGWKDMPSMPVTYGANANDPAESAVDAHFMRALEFTNATAGNEKTVYFNVHINHDYLMGSRVYLHCHWMSGNTTATTVARWTFTFSAAKGHGQQAFDTTGTTVSVDQTLNGTAYMHYVTEVTDANAVPATNLEPDSIISCRLLRDSAHANDTMTTSAWLLFVDCHYLSTEGGTPGKAPPFYR